MPWQGFKFAQVWAFVETDWLGTLKIVHVIACKFYIPLKNKYWTLVCYTSRNNQEPAIYFWSKKLRWVNEWIGIDKTDMWQNSKW